MTGRWPAAGERRDRLVSDVLLGLVVLVVVVVGLPQVWRALSTGSLGLELFFYPLLGAAFGAVALRRRAER